MKPRRVFASSFVLTIAVAPTVLADPTPTPAKHWSITKPKGADSCVATEVGKKKTSTPYICPEEMKLPVKVVKPAGSTECFVDDGGRGARGNPPAPTDKLRCPK